MQQQHCWETMENEPYSTVQYSTVQYCRSAHVVLSLEDKGELKLEVVSMLYIWGSTDTKE